MFSVLKSKDIEVLPVNFGCKDLGKAQARRSSLSMTRDVLCPSPEP
jgi:hypothetical protein